MTINTWGEATWGDGYYGVEYVDIIPDGRNIRDAEVAWDIPATIEKGSRNYKLLQALISSAINIDRSLEYIYNSNKINHAAGDDLDRIGNFIGVTRKQNELDGKYRARIKGEFRAGTIEPTTDNFAEFVSTLLSVDPSNFTLIREQFRPEITISAQGDVWGSANLTIAELITILEQAVPAGHAVGVQERGTFRLKVDGEVDDPDGGLTSDSIETGGTLASNLI